MQGLAVQHMPGLLRVFSGEIDTMKLLFTSAAAIGLAAATGASAGGLAEPVMEAEVVEAATSSASQEFIVPLLLVLVILAALSSPDAPLP